jgi:hypothetical protein
MASLPCPATADSVDTSRIDAKALPCKLRNITIATSTSSMVICGSLPIATAAVNANTMTLVKSEVGVLLHGPRRRAAREHV